jgi:hypothetical protein
MKAEIQNTAYTRKSQSDGRKENEMELRNMKTGIHENDDKGCQYKKKKEYQK